MKIYLFGYGQMGKEVEKMAKERGHEISGIADPAIGKEIDIEILASSDIAIEYSIPDCVSDNILTCFENKIPVVVGTTGWYDNFEHISNKCSESGGTLFYATNFSIGVNILFKINEVLSSIMNKHTDYDLSIKEVHHTKKKDAPSGTAVTLGKSICSNIEKYDSWTTLEAGKSFQNKNRIFPVFYERTEGAIGEHIVNYRSGIDELSIRHNAFNRKGFTLGTLLASEWVANKKGIFTMSDMLEI